LEASGDQDNIDISSAQFYGYSLNTCQEISQVKVTVTATEFIFEDNNDSFI